MKYCVKCGSEISDDKDICTDCETKCSDVQEEITANQPAKRSVMAIIAFTISVVVFVYIAIFTVEFFAVDDLGFLFIALILLVPSVPGCLISLTLSIIAVCLVVKNKRRGKGLAVASLVLSILSVCAILSTVIWMALIPALAQ